MKLNELKYIEGYKIYVSFDNGIKGAVDLADLVNQGIFTELENKEKFAAVYATDYSIAWSDDLEIDLASIYAELSGEKPEIFFRPNVSHALN